MDSREQAENAFKEADKANAQESIERLVRLATAYKIYLKEDFYAKSLLKQYKDALKDSRFTHSDVIAVVTLTSHDSLNKYVIQEAGNIKEVE